ncbi:MAG: DUF5674 family protein [Endomicrobia bacterium]|nr:DUF5674 family protein [Endomicrobiia bacterium]
MYPFKYPNDWIEFDSMINLTPSLVNKSRFVEEPSIKKRIIEIVEKLIVK